MNEITLKENTEIVDISKEKKPRRRFGDRKDGRRIRSIEPISLVSPFIMETRNGSMNYIKDAVPMENMEKFLYVFNKEARDRLLAANYTLLKSDEKNETYVFANQMDMTFALADISFIRSNTLTF